MRNFSLTKAILCFRTLNSIAKFSSVPVALKTVDKSGKKVYSVGLDGRPAHREVLISLLYEFDGGALIRIAPFLSKKWGIHSNSSYVLIMLVVSKWKGRSADTGL